MSELIRREDVQREIQASFDEGAFRWQDGQDLMDRINALPTVHPWHRVEDGLPDKVGSYLVYAPAYVGGSSSEKECKAGVMFARWLKGGHWSIEVGYYKRPGCVTHWMPIEPPKEDA